MNPINTNIKELKNLLDNLEKGEGKRLNNNSTKISFINLNNKGNILIEIRALWDETVYTPKQVESLYEIS